MSELGNADLTQRIIGAAIEVHRSLGPGFLESIYEAAMAVELKAVNRLEDIHFSIVRSYMKALNVRDALLLNFASMPLTIQRVGREWAVVTETSS